MSWELKTGAETLKWTVWGLDSGRAGDLCLKVKKVKCRGHYTLYCVWLLWYVTIHLIIFFSLLIHTVCRNILKDVHYNSNLMSEFIHSTDFQDKSLQIRRALVFKFSSLKIKTRRVIDEELVDSIKFLYDVSQCVHMWAWNVMFSDCNTPELTHTYTRAHTKKKSVDLHSITLLNQSELHLLKLCLVFYFEGSYSFQSEHVDKLNTCINDFFWVTVYNSFVQISPDIFFYMEA